MFFFQSPGDNPDQAAAGSADSDSILNTMTSITKQRVKLNIKVLGVQLGEKGAVNQSNNMTEGEKQTFREQFKAPEMSIVSKLMAKVCKQYYQYLLEESGMSPISYITIKRTSTNYNVYSKKNQAKKILKM